MVVGALAGVAVVLAAVAWWSMRLILRSPDRSGGVARPAAYLAVGVTAIGAFAGALLVAGIVVALAVPAVACAVGFALAAVTAGEDDDDDRGLEPDDEPPWWPGFERELRRYDRRRIRT